MFEDPPEEREIEAMIAAENGELCMTCGETPCTCDKQYEDSKEANDERL